MGTPADIAGTAGGGHDAGKEGNPETPTKPKRKVTASKKKRANTDADLEEEGDEEGGDKKRFKQEQDMEA